MQKHTSFFQKKMVRISVLVLTGIIVLAGVVTLTQQSGALTGALTKTIWAGSKNRPAESVKPNPMCISNCKNKTSACIREAESMKKAPNSAIKRMVAQCIEQGMQCQKKCVK